MFILSKFAHSFWHLSHLFLVIQFLIDLTPLKAMNNLIITLTILSSLIGLFISVQTLITTRKKYYKDYLKRKRNGKN